MLDEESDEDTQGGVDGKEIIKETLFDDDDEEVPSTPARQKETEEEGDGFVDLDEDEESGGWITLRVVLPLQTVTVLFCNFFFFQSRIQIYSPKCS
jgi:hypothetical protein